MIVYRDVVLRVDRDDLVAKIGELARRGPSADLLVELGQLEQAIADARYPERDDWTERDRLLRDAIVATAADADVGADGPREFGLASSSLREAAADAPPVLHVRPPEGYAHYGLDPEAYRATARAYRREAGDRARRAVVVGIRSIGTSLSAVVAATLGSHRSVTIRPRGPSGARSIRSTDRLDETVREGVPDGDVLLVDEGPGVTGETFACVARWIREIGIPSDRIVLLPSHDGAMPLAPEKRRRWFRESRRHLPPTRDDRARTIALHRGWSEPEDLSAGGWRSVVSGGRALPTCPHFERLKYRVRDRTGRPRLVRYGGLGSFGRRLLGRSRCLARALADFRGAPGFEPLRAEMLGFVSRGWIEGRPAGEAGVRRPAFRRAVGSYVLARAGHFGTGEAVDRTAWRRVLVENAGEAGADPVALSAAVCRLEALSEREAVLPDGRLQAHEWIVGGGRIWKVDALEHGDGFRLPGPADAVWDLVGAALELRLSESEQRELIGRFAERLGERPHDCGNAVLAYRPVYAAAAWGEAALSARELGDTAEGRRMEALASRYSRMLDHELERTATGWATVARRAG